ncbi:MAG: matrixin family metalloprotease [Candidatus Pacebacteria bacterium]|nr:matrixin family metalloprotease [Candidatus Paceibacterota bacterium]
MFKIKNLFGQLTLLAVAAVVLPSGQIISVPQQAIDHSPALESVTFIHYRDGSAKPGSSIKTPTLTCYGFISKGTKLTSIENLSINPANSGMLEADVLNQTMISAAEWDNNTSKTIWGNFNVDYSANFDSVADGINEISFGPYSDPNVIAVTRIWGVFSGRSKYIDQFDILFNTAYQWGDVSATGNVNLMDYMNIATHEIGHGVGLSDLYNACSDETMYGYSGNGETKKRNLNPGDIKGLQTLYGI